MTFNHHGCDIQQNFLGGGGGASFGSTVLALGCCLEIRPCLWNVCRDCRYSSKCSHSSNEMPEHQLTSRYFRLQQFCPIAVRHAPVSWEQPCREVITHYSVLEANQITREICTFKWQLWRLMSSNLTWLAINYSQKFLKQCLNILHNSSRILTVET
jgi:hypothetical protein